MNKITVLAPDDPSMVAALTSFRVDGMASTKANNELMMTLANKFGILTTRRTGPERGDCIRITPSIYNSPEDVLKLVSALKEVTSL